MGCFDTFVGDINCTHCNKKIHFVEQTKDYECLLQEFKIGDYIDKGNANYFYEFDYPCAHCKENITVYAAIRRGQLIGYYTNVFNLDISSMDNIEENYQRNAEYREMCESGYGVDKNIYDKKKYFHVGDIIHILNRDWIVETVYEEQIKQDMENEGLILHNCIFKENKCYKVHDNKGNQRLIITRENELTYVTGLTGCVCDNSYGVYSGQLGTELVTIENKNNLVEDIICGKRLGLNGYCPYCKNLIYKIDTFYKRKNRCNHCKELIRWQ